MYFQIGCQRAMKLRSKLHLALLGAFLSVSRPLSENVSIKNVLLDPFNLKVWPQTKYLINKAGVFVFVANVVYKP